MKKFFLTIILAVPLISAQAAEPFVSFKKCGDAPFALSAKGRVAAIVCDESEDAGILMAIGSLKADIERVTGVAPEVRHSSDAPCLIIGSLNTPLVKGLAKNGKLPAGELANYTTLTFTFSNLVDGPVRMGYYVGSTFTEFGNGYYSAGTKTVDLTALSIDFSSVSKISFGGRTGTGSVNIFPSDVILTK